MFGYVHQQLAFSFTEHEIVLREKKIGMISWGWGPPWRVGPVDLATPVSMVAQPQITNTLSGCEYHNNRQS